MKKINKLNLVDDTMVIATKDGQPFITGLDINNAWHRIDSHIDEHNKTETCLYLTELVVTQKILDEWAEKTKLIDSSEYKQKSTQDNYQLNRTFFLKSIQETITPEILKEYHKNHSVFSDEPFVKKEEILLKGLIDKKWHEKITQLKEEYNIIVHDDFIRKNSPRINLNNLINN